MSATTGRTWHPAIAIVALLNAVGAAFGAIGLAGGWLYLGDELTARLPWGSAVVGGTALAVVVALPNAALAAAALRRRAGAGPLSVFAGCLMVGWILVELAFIRELSYFHPLYTAVGLLQIWLGVRAIRASTGITGTDLLHEAGAVVADLPLFLTAPLYRRWHLRWQATDAEVTARMPGDDRLPLPAYSTTRAITIDADPDQVWPWLVQVGCLRAGFYSDDLLDNLGRPSSRTLVPELQHLEVGQLVPMSPRPTPETSFEVAAYDVPRDLLWTKKGSTWAWRLVEEAPGRTRLVTRVRAVHDWSRPWAGLFSLVLLEFGDFPMLRRMLLGIKERAEDGSSLPG